MRALGAYAIWFVLAAFAATIVRSRREGARGWQPAAMAAVCLASVFAFVVTDWGRATPFGDFNKAYYAAGARILTNPSALYACDVSNLCFVNLPLVALAFTPLVVLGRTGAQAAFTVIGVAAVVAAAAITIRELRAAGASRYAIVALLALNGPLMYSIRLGNVSHVLLPVLALAFIWLARGREALAGIAFAVLTLNKLPFLLFLVYLVLRRRWIAAAAFGASVAAAVLASLSLFGAGLHEEWIGSVIGPFARWPIGAYNVQSISGLLAHYLMPGHLTDWVPLPPTLSFTVARYAILLAIGSLVAVTLARGGAPRHARELFLELHIVLMVALLASPLTWTHYYAFVVVPLAGLFAECSRGRERGIVALAAILVSLPVVLPRIPHPVAAALVERVLISHYVWGALLLVAALCAERVSGAAPASIDQTPEELGARSLNR